MTSDEISGIVIGIAGIFFVILLLITLIFQANPFEYIADVTHEFFCVCVEHHLRRERHKKGGKHVD